MPFGARKGFVCALASSLFPVRISLTFPSNDPYFSPWRRMTQFFYPICLPRKAVFWLNWKFKYPFVTFTCWPSIDVGMCYFNEISFWKKSSESFCSRVLLVFEETWPSEKSFGTKKFGNPGLLVRSFDNSAFYKIIVYLHQCDQQTLLTRRAVVVVKWSGCRLLLRRSELKSCWRLQFFL